jgi:hypothetical protein
MVEYFIFRNSVFLPGKWGEEVEYYPCELFFEYFSGQKGEKIIYSEYMLGEHRLRRRPFSARVSSPHPSQQQFASPEISESNPAYRDDVVFSLTTTTPAVCMRGQVDDLNRSFDSPSLALRRAHVFYGDSPGASRSSVGRRLFGRRHDEGLGPNG